MTHLPSRPRTSEMTFWSRYDPIRLSPGSTDYWAKMRVRAEKQSDRLKYGVSSLSTVPAGIPRGSQQNMTPRFQISSGSFLPLPDLVFPTLPVPSPRRQLQLAGDAVRSSPPARFRRSWMDNEFNRRAREGFRYWLIERPKPTTFGKYGIGSYKTALGVGNAPRT